MGLLSLTQLHLGHFVLTRKHASKRKMSKRETDIKMGTTGQERCHTKGRKSCQRRTEANCQMTHIKWKCLRKDDDDDDFICSVTNQKQLRHVTLYSLSSKWQHAV
jgi:hypothetical protein